MRNTRLAALGVTGIAAALILAGCSGSAGGSGGSGSGGSAADLSKVDGKGKTITVWVMNGDLSTDTVDAVNAEFEKATGAKVNVQMQQWDGITTKLTTALAGSSAPDVVDMGNTQVASYAATGGLADITAYRTQLEQGQTWLGGLVDPATVDGKLYAVPSFAGDRAVVYNKKMWADAGITEAPTSYDEFTADLDKIKAKNTASDFSAMYLPGQFWYAGMQFVWDAGGDIATSKDGKWTAGFSSAAAQKGLKAFKTFQNTYSTPASTTVNTNAPDQDAIFANGQTSAVLATAAHVKKIMDANPALTADTIGTFPFPGRLRQEPAGHARRQRLGCGAEEQEPGARTGLDQDRRQPDDPARLRVRQGQLDPEQQGRHQAGRLQPEPAAAGLLHRRAELEGHAGRRELGHHRGRQDDGGILPVDRQG